MPGIYHRTCILRCLNENHQKVGRQQYKKVLGGGGGFEPVEPPSVKVVIYDAGVSTAFVIGVKRSK